MTVCESFMRPLSLISGIGYVCDNCDSDCESFMRLLALLTSEQVYVKLYARVREPHFLAKGPF